MTRNNAFIAGIKKLQIKSNQGNSSKFKALVKSGKETKTFFGKDANSVMYFILKGIEYEQQDVQSEKSDDFLDKVSNYLEGHNFKHKICDLGELLNKYKSKPYLLAFSLVKKPELIIMDPNIFLRVLTYLFNKGVERIENFEDLTTETIVAPLIKDLTAELERNDEENVVTSFVIDGSNVARNRNNSKDAIIQDVLLCRKELMDKGVPKNNIVIVFGSGLRYHLQDMDKKSFEELIKQENIVQAPAKQDDDLFIIKYAKRSNSYIVTNDLYRDYREKDPKLKRYIEIRLIKYAIIKDTITFDEDIKKLIS